MSYQIIILFAISAVVIYFSIAELVWQFRNRHFRRRLIIGVLIAALLVSHIDFINLFTKTDAETVLAAAADADTDASTERVEASVIEKLSDGLKRRVATVGTALDELMQPDTWKVVRTSTDMDIASVEEPEVDANLLAEERSGDTEGEIPTETEEGIEEENSAEAGNSTEEENPTEPENSIEEESPAEAEKGTEGENPAETEKGTEGENPAETEKDTEEENPTEEESLKEDSMENSTESEKSSDEAESEADTKNKKEAAGQAGKDSGGRTAVLSADDAMLMANTIDHDSLDWEPWESDNSLPSDEGNYYLTKNVNLPSPYTWNVKGTINICLNGYKYIFTGEYEIIIDSGDGKITTTDICNGSHKTYIITYNGGKYGVGEVESRTKTHGKDIELSKKTFTRTGHKQTGWAESDGGVLRYGLGDIYKDDQDITLYPVWEAEIYTVTYNKNEGAIANESDYVEYTYGVGLELPIPTREGYAFEGWYTNDSFNGTAVTSISTTDTDNKTFYAKWAVAYTITYYPGDFGAEDAKKQIKIKGVDIDLFLAVFTRPGYVQTGWAVSNGGVLKYELGESYKEDKGIELYPVWTDAYTISYNGGSYGKGEVEAQVKTHGKDIELTKKTFTRTGYTQTGWAESDGGALKYELGGRYTDNKGITLYPVWTVNTYTVRYEKDGGTIADESNYTSYVYGKGLNPLPKPTRSGYVFMGWYTDKDFNGSEAFSISTTATGNKTFYAKWEKIVSEDNGGNEDYYDDGGDSSSDNGDTGSGDIGNTQPDTDDQTESDADDADDSDDTDDTDEDLEDEDADDSEDDDIDDTDDADSSDEQAESEADDDMESSGESPNSAGEAGTKSANRSVQAGLENGEIVISGNPDGADGTGAGGNGAGGETSGEESANASIGTVTIPGEESAATVLVVGEGSVIVTVVSDEWKYGAGVADTVAVANTVLTSEQKQLVNSGENIEIRLVVKDISGLVSEGDKSIIEDGLKADKEGESGKLIPAAYIDISLDIRTGDGDWEAVTRTDKPIKVVVGISEEWSDDRAFYIARSHESEYALLEDLDSESDTVTIMTDLFSTYAIVYRQMPVIVIDADRISDFVTSNSWITVAGIGVVLLYIGILEILGIIAILLLWKQYKKEKKDAKRDIVTP